MATEKGKLGSNVIRVKLIKQKKYGLGFLVRPRSKQPYVVVSDLVSGGMAADSGLVQIGDVILKVNDVSLEDLPYEKSLDMLKALPVNSPVVLILRGPEGYLSHLETRFNDDGVPRTIRVTKPVLHSESILDRIKKTLTGASASPKACRTKQTQANCECRDGNKKRKSKVAEMESVKLSPNGDILTILDQTDTDISNGSPTDSNKNHKAAVDESANGCQETGAANNLISDSLDIGKIKSQNSNSASAPGRVESANLIIENGGGGAVNNDSAASRGGSSLNPGVSEARGSSIHMTNGTSSRVTGHESGSRDINKTGDHSDNNSSAAEHASAGLSAERNNIKQTTPHKMGQKNGEDIGKSTRENGTNKGMNGSVNGEGVEGSPVRMNGARKGLDLDNKMGNKSPIKKFVKLRNVGNERPLCTDTLHMKSAEVSITLH